jgi:hypothetical protein
LSFLFFLFCVCFVCFVCFVCLCLCFFFFLFVCFNERLLSAVAARFQCAPMSLWAIRIRIQNSSTHQPRRGAHLRRPDASAHAPFCLFFPSSFCSTGRRRSSHQCAPMSLWATPIRISKFSDSSKRPRRARLRRPDARAPAPHQLQLVHVVWPALGLLSQQRAEGPLRRLLTKSARDCTITVRFFLFAVCTLEIQHDPEVL